MKNKQFHFKVLALLSLLAIAISCEKPPEPEPENQEPVMPALTHTGANTFGCYIDGELFVANEGESVWDIPPVSGSFDEETKRLSLQAMRYSVSVSESIVFFVIVDRDKDDYVLDINYDYVNGYDNMGGESCTYIHNLDNIGSCTITYIDESKNIISGTFYMELINEDCADKDVMSITDGRFDFRY